MAKEKKKLSAYNRHVQSEMKKGKTMKQAAASWKKGSTKSTAARVRSTNRSKPKAKPKGGNRTVGKKSFNTQKLFKYVRLGALAAPIAGVALSSMSTEDKIRNIARNLTGYDYKYGVFDWKWLAQGYGPFVAASAVTYGIPKLTSIIRGL